MQRFCLTLDLKEDVQAIAHYEAYHKKIPDVIDQSIRDAGIINLEIYRLGTRMFMILEAEDDFTFEKKAAMDAANPAVQEWEQLMWEFQQPLPEAKPGEKWLLMHPIFKL